MERKLFPVLIIGWIGIGIILSKTKIVMFLSMVMHLTRIIIVIPLTGVFVWINPIYLVQIRSTSIVRCGLLEPVGLWHQRSLCKM